MTDDELRALAEKWTDVWGALREQRAAHEKELHAERMVGLNEAVLLVHLRDERDALAKRLDEAERLLARVAKYVIEDRAVTTGSTRLSRVTTEIRAFLASPNPPEPQRQGTAEELHARLGFPPLSDSQKRANLDHNLSNLAPRGHAFVRTYVDDGLDTSRCGLDGCGKTPGEHT